MKCISHELTFFYENTDREEKNMQTFKKWCNWTVSKMKIVTTRWRLCIVHDDDDNGDKTMMSSLFRHVRKENDQTHKKNVEINKKIFLNTAAFNWFGFFPPISSVSFISDAHSKWNCTLFIVYFKNLFIWIDLIWSFFLFVFFLNKTYWTSFVVASIFIKCGKSLMWMSRVQWSK